MYINIIAIIYVAILIISSLISLYLYKRDKKLAEGGNMRIKEKNLLMCSCFGGAIGSLIGRIIFHHKTDKKYFSLVIYFSLLMEIIAGVIIIYMVVR